MTLRLNRIVLWLFCLLCLVSVPVLAAAFVPTASLAVLTYHDIGMPEVGYCISRERFLSHLNALQQEGYTFLPLEAVGLFLEGRYVPPSKAVVLTFDDGYASFYQEVYPILRERAIPAAVFLITGDVGRGRRLTWAQIREMERDPGVHIRFYAHAHNGHELIDTDGDKVPDTRFYAGRQWLAKEGRRETTEEYRERIRKDLRAARKAIETHLGHASPYFAVPGSGWSRVLARVAQEEGYRYLFAPTWGKFVQRGWSPQRLPRLDAGSIRPDGKAVTPEQLLNLLRSRDLRGNLNRTCSRGLLP
ncbi:MAG: polysaccharide deacetylase family protein [Clostridia bacterium]|nr:polysaccharide deacetylase family protein [Clostridia bacterium]